MQIVDKRTVYSATDLNNYLECRHLVTLERAAAAGELRRPERPASLELIAEKGRQHEQRYLEKLRVEREVVEIVQPANSEGAIELAAIETVAAMARGAAAIYQGTFYDGEFQGRPDFLLRVETPSAEWPWSYEVADTKLALHDKPYFIIQLCHYSEHLARVQGISPKRMHVVLGDETQKAYRVEDFAAYYRHLKRSFLESRSEADVYPFEVSHCSICDWAEHCEQRRERDDHLGLVAWMRHDQIQRLESANISTVAALAAVDASRPNGMREETFVRLHRQASLQVRGRQTGSNLYELLDHGPFEGFGLMPKAAHGDVFFDMEGDPLFDIGTGLEYLFGCYTPDDEPAFRAFWGTDRQAEKLAFERCVDFLIARRQHYPEMHVYHYAPYEKTALRELAQRHATREEEVDQLLEGQVLVDLYAVVRQTLLISKPSYSIKQLEPFYGMKRDTEVRRGDDSVVKFETWLLAPTRGEILEDIERYNEQDCISTHRLRDWLLGRREEYQSTRGVALQFRPIKGPDELCHDEPVDGCKKCEIRVRDERELAKMSADQQALCARTYDKAAVLLGGLLSYHRREEKPVWWAFFDRCENTDGLLEFDREAIAGLMLRRDIPPFRRAREQSETFTYSFPDQFFHLGVGDSVYDPFTTEPAGTIVHIDEEANTLQLKLKKGGTSDDAEKITALIPGGPIVAKEQKSSLARIAAAYLAGSLESTNRIAADLLRRQLPRLAGRPSGSRIQPDTVSPESVYEVAKALDRSYLFVQGPPGSGKTYTGARLIVKLIADGKRVGVMANSHRSIHNLLHEIERVAQANRVGVRGIHKHSTRNEGSEYVSEISQPLITSAPENAPVEDGDHNLVSGNSFLFSRAGMAGRVDYLIIDEAGQTSLADAVAVSPSATNMILLGDPMQLAQVSTGSHPEGVDKSILEHLLQDDSTVAEDRGILLDISYRMHPEICEFVSQTMYDGRLHADPPNALNAISSIGLTGGGVRFIPVAHSGNTRDSFEEAQRIADEIGRLLAAGTFTRRGAPAAPLGEADILVVTPYNAQRRRILERLRAAGHSRVRVGTVDKFQGQEAPVVFYSMATSSGDDVPRTMEFLYERNRFNVAVSRAQCMSVLVCSPKLFEIRCNRPEQIKLVNILCRFVEMARPASEVLSS